MRVSLVQTQRSCPLGFLVQLALVWMRSVQVSPRLEPLSDRWRASGTGHQAACRAGHCPAEMHGLAGWTCTSGHYQFLAVAGNFHSSQNPRWYLDHVGVCGWLGRVAHSASSLTRCLDPDRLLCRNWPQCSSTMTSMKVGLMLQLQLLISLFEFVYIWRAGGMTRMNCMHALSVLLSL